MKAAISNKYPSMELEGKDKVFIETFFENLANTAGEAYNSVTKIEQEMASQDTDLQSRNKEALARRLAETA